jgi:hypothetical protein
MPKIIEYTLKDTAARTQYVTIDDQDLDWLKAQLIQYLAVIAELDSTHDEDQRYFREQWCHRRQKTLPKGRNGLNTPASYIGGLVSNTVFGEQRDFTRHQLDAVEIISSGMSIYDQNLFSQITFRQRLFSD